MKLELHIVQKEGSPAPGEVSPPDRLDKPSITCSNIRSRSRRSHIPRSRSGLRFRGKDQLRSSWKIR